MNGCPLWVILVNLDGGEDGQADTVSGLRHPNRIGPFQFFRCFPRQRPTDRVGDGLPHCGPAAA
ncbi:hypothetical protein HYPGJ_20205 [Hyphomicrobium sp. GJ21]|nr:hypothetical protein HYPGJ_20205 [Hyphomicrobium sp. GJ21]